MKNNTFDIINPYTHKLVGSADSTSPEQVEMILSNSHNTKLQYSPLERAELLIKVASRLDQKKQEFANIITSESGLCLKDTLIEVDRTIDVARYSALVAERMDKDITPDYVLNNQYLKPKLNVITEPIDLAASITPFNHPLNQVAHKVFPALAAGACIVVKPSEKTPLAAIALRELLIDIGIDENFYNLILDNQPEKIVSNMLSYDFIDLLSFTGGYDVGRKVQLIIAKTSKNFIKYIPELGGCSSLIVNNDADIDLAVENAVIGCFKNSGQRCTAVRKVIVINDIANIFIDKMKNAISKISYGNPYDTDMDMGTLISSNAADKVEKRVNKAIEDGADLITGNIRDDALYSPTLLDNVPIDTELAIEETFGPICPVIRAKTIQDAVNISNLTGYRLAGAIITQNKEVACQVSNTLKVGQFSWNGVPGYRKEYAPFGGFRKSGNGEKEGVICFANSLRRIRTFYEH